MDAKKKWTLVAFLMSAVMQIIRQAIDLFDGDDDPQPAELTAAFDNLSIGHRNAMQKVESLGGFASAGEIMQNSEGESPPIDLNPKYGGYPPPASSA
jgi:hypothetical protein